MNTIQDIKDDEKEAVKELRERMKGDMEPELYEDIYMFYRFLKAQSFNVNNAEQMLRKHLEWCEKTNIKEYRLPEVVQKYYSFVFLGYDKEGCVVRYSPLGNIDSIGVLASIKSEDIEKLAAYYCEEDAEKLKIQSKKLGRIIDQCIYIHNLENISFRKVTDKKVLYSIFRSLTLYQNHYPERMKATYIINCFSYMGIVYGILKKVLAPQLLAKFHIYSDDSWKKDLLKEIDADVLPKFLGGNRTDPDGNPLCLTFINHGEPVPEKYYIHRSKRSLSTMEGVKKINLSKADFHEEILIVTIPGSHLEWEFETKSRDIGFGVFYEENADGKEEMVELISHQRIDTEEYSEIGTYICEKAGKYVVLFDNTYSWIRSKEIYYRIKVVTPEEEETALNK